MMRRRRSANDRYGRDDTNEQHILANRPLTQGGVEVDVYRTGNPHFARYGEDLTHQASVEAPAHANALLILPLMISNKRRGIVEIVLEQAELAKSNMIAELKTAVQTIGLLAQRVERMSNICSKMWHSKHATL